ncbi:alpha/beta fold hydrolase [Pseudoteredinibacter isoporae]|uniref:Pimeloyl-ACP methyl ester carboxylesterase n=1 Tax=Pseudoteredinibacter isoporae TaxID=570281 RepID=A0A7X0JRU1_9GAMM|nr:alpha/beta hydrolase [Pseudoteredinibacter isoporae]MBB6520236.1 pimeloyl-ACP methyl ester carboxylesterase [Pseudoteredinibacter isoporae]NHO85808.1 alpha/beta hydrolase [Pseudoteredinibacter isoporae]NIB25740.1 alpha/beta hydrolase [Pseudoteredinibacter isoporae]
MSEKADKNTASEANISKTIENWRSKGLYRQLCGHRIFTIDEWCGNEQKPTVVLIHGFPSSSWDWEAIWEPLQGRYRLVTLDMLGFGFSDKPNKRNYSIHGQADLFEALIRELGLEQYHILAHDYGDTVAQELLARQLEGSGAGKCLSACFLNGGIFPETHRALLTQKLLLSPLGPLINHFNGFASFKKNFSSVFGPASKPTEFELQVFWQLINENNGKHLFHNLITYINDRKQHRERWIKPLQESSIPLALINGSADPVSGAHMVARYKELNCRLDYLKELPLIGHYPQVEDSEGVLDGHLEFLRFQ